MTTLRPAVDNFLQMSNATFFMDVFAGIVDADDPSIHTTHKVILDLDVLVADFLTHCYHGGSASRKGIYKLLYKGIFRRALSQLQNVPLVLI